MIIYQVKDVRGRYLDKPNVVGCRHQYTGTTSLLDLIRRMLKVEITTTSFWCDSEIHPETPKKVTFLKTQQSVGSTEETSQQPPPSAWPPEVGRIMALRKESGVG